MKTFLEWYFAAGVVIFIAGSLAGTKPTPTEGMPVWLRWVRAFIAVCLLWPISFTNFVIGLTKIFRGLWKTRHGW